MLELLWQKAKHVVPHENVLLPCCLTIYSRNRKVVDEIVDAYLNCEDFAFDKLMNEIHLGHHSIYVSEHLAKASQKLIELKKSDQVASIEGAACHLSCNISPTRLRQLIHHKKEFRQHLREFDGFCITPARIERQERTFLCAP